MRRVALILLLAATGCAALGPPPTPEQMPRGFSRPGSPYPYNSPGW
jgi:hypothetical protein